jgi:ArsR family transcriptional regulator, arsenate/arsenite/antimonite-responsive transcriptional repressor
MGSKKANATVKLSSVALSEEQFQSIARALADPHRFAILEQVAAAEGMPCSRLHEHDVISPATVSHHMKELSEAGLIEVKREGRDAYVSLHRPVLDAYLKRLTCL